MTKEYITFVVLLDKLQLLVSDFGMNRNGHLHALQTNISTLFLNP